MLTQLENEVIRCIKCGACQSVCPIYKELKTEASVARGKLNLIKAAMKGDVELTDSFVERMSWCLLCKACIENCPSGVKVDALIVGARRELAEQKGLPFLKKMVFRMALKNPRVFNIGLSMGSVLQKLLFRPAPKGEGMLPRLPMGLDKRRMLSPIARNSFRSRHPEIIKVSGAKGTAAFFTGCMINYIYPQVGDAVVKLLTRNKFNVIIPAGQHCCGTPAYTSGDVDTAVELSKAVVDTFAGLKVDAVVTACGSCGLALTKDYAEILKDLSKYQEKALDLSTKIYDITKFLSNIGFGQEGAVEELPKKVTYHESCHLTRGLGIKGEPRQLIRTVPGVQLVEMKNPGRCCGCAGSFSLSHYDLTMKINKYKVSDIVSTNAAILVTGCPACMMQIKDGLVQEGRKIQVMHTAELLALS